MRSNKSGIVSTDYVSWYFMMDEIKENVVEGYFEMYLRELKDNRMDESIQRILLLEGTVRGACCFTIQFDTNKSANRN